MIAYWHRVFSPFGFYDGGQHIVVVPHAAPPPAIVVDHESTHINLVNGTTIGLLQQLCTAATAVRPEVHLAASIAKILLRSTEKTHEAVAWFGTEVLSKINGLEVETPPEYANLTHELRSAIEKCRGQTYVNWKSAFSSVMAVAEAAGKCALSPGELGRMVCSDRALDDELLERILADPKNNPEKRFRELCDVIRGSQFAKLEKWAHSMWNADGTLRTSELSGADRITLRAFTRDNVDDNTCARRLSELTGTQSTASSLTEWKLFCALNCFIPSIDRYAQTCVVEKPFLARKVEIPEAHAVEVLGQVPYVIVSAGENLAFERSSPLMGQEVSIAVGPRIKMSAIDATKDAKSFWRRLWSPKATSNVSEQHVKATWTTNPDKAKSFLRRFVEKGGGVVAAGAFYDYGRGDLIERTILEDIPHSVLHITDVKSLWIRLGIINDRGLASSRKIKYKFLPSKGAPDDFGYLVLRPHIGSIPMVVVPCLSKFIKRAVSVFESLPSPHRIEVELSDWPEEAFAFGCERALASALESFEPNLNWSN
jgi:hypothetical protein